MEAALLGVYTARMSLDRSDPPVAPQPPTRPAPEGACDTHIHMLANDMPMWPGRVEDPAALGFADYLAVWRAEMAANGIDRTVVVQSILYGTDNTVTLRTVEELGRNAARAVVLVTDQVTDAELDELVARGAVGVRLNYVHGGVLTWDGVEAIAPRLADRGLHIQMLCMADRHLPDLASRIAALPVPVVLDHMAWPNVSAGPTEPGFATLCRLLERHDVYVKLSAPYRLAEAPFDRLDDHIRALLAANAQRCLWGSDWPQIMLNGARRASGGTLLDAFDRVCPNDATRNAVLVDNPARLYGF
ncbi:amidohydrolase family protein [Jannaschia aquimarina]|uniref:LigI protein n=1 Tax=Jannaschia aquimarina TaxID=935700 RepID=A0A0D1EJN4_9RHOB|nr:amidohydrolase family protein [Jannaschia aquimarina]KIT16010.1 2-pyrone-4,6-dicarbaxylate hydrolase [Jannaschia aquimarina]SNT00003.1 Predicted metal-dependent hydrolase, TIM-barrel fold [Jannaschia aquimarina]